MLPVVIVLLGLAAIVYLVMETHLVRYSNIQLNHSSAMKFKIMQLSDLHGRTRFLNGSISGLVNRMEPDLVVLTGDLITKKSQLARVAAEIRNIECRRIYFIPGNHEREESLQFRKRLYTSDEYELIIQTIRNQGVTVLENSGAAIDVNGKQLYIYGFDNSIYGNERDNTNTSDWNTYDYVILLAHSPGITQITQRNQIPYDLLLVGHTHGGQVRLFGRTMGPHKHSHVGLRRIDGRRHFYINRGLGTVKIPVRVACPPEIAVFHIGGDPQT